MKNLMNPVLAPAEGANFKTVKSHISPRTYHFVGVRSLVALASVVFLAVMSATAQTVTTDLFVLKITINHPLFAFRSFTFYTQDTNYDIDWDNDQIFESADTGVSGSQSHTFTTVGEYTIRFRNLNDVHINNQAGREKYTSIEQWGTAVWDADMSFAFQGASSLTMTATDTPNMSAVTNMRSMFYGATSFNGDLSEWNTASVTNMYGMFSEASAFNQDLSKWNTAKVTNMLVMFSGATKFNGDISGWNVEAVTNMRSMFYGATSFNGDLSGWNTASVTNMYSMFSGASSFNGDISRWITASVMSMYRMFSEATKFNGDISGWNVEAVTNMRSMFYGATSFNGDLSEWNTASVTNMYSMFSGASSFNGDISRWITASVMSMYRMFSEATKFNGDISGWNTESVTNMHGMFQDATFFDQNIGGWNTAKVTNTDYMFNGATSFDKDIGNWNTAKVTNMEYMFNGATSFTQNISRWNVEAVTNMQRMFSGATSFNQDLSGWNTASVTDMFSMFRKATSFDQDIGGWNVEAVTTMQRMFYGVTLSFKNYDSLLVRWNRQNLRPSVVFDGGNSSYMSTQAQTARANMISSTGHDWTITDGGLRTMNQAPTDIFLSSINIAENAGVNAVVGMLSNTDTGGMYTYTLVDGDGDADNGSFNILGTTLRLTASADYETLAIIPPQTTRSRANYSVRINVSDGTHDFAKEFTISLDDVNEAPTARDDAFSVAESSANGTPVGTVLATDPDPVQNPSFTYLPNVNSTLTYAITGGNTGSVFAIDPTTGEITVADALDYETTPSYSLVVTVTDRGRTSRLSDTATLTITVTDVANESNAPVFAEGAVATVLYAENDPTAVTTVIATDADARQTVTFTLTGGADESKFSLSSTGELTFNIAPDYENPVDVGTDNIYEVIITASDDDTPALTATQMLTITVTDVEVEYLFSASQRTFTPLTDATAVTSLEADDALSLSLPVGFDFTFYGTTYSTLKASSNGVLTFNPAHTNSLVDNEIAGTSLTHAIMPFWDDLDGSSTVAQASYKVTGSSPNRVYTFEWLNFRRRGSSGVVSFQVSLHESANLIELAYGPGVAGSFNASIGIKGVANDFFSLAGSGTSPMRSVSGINSIATRPPNGQVYQFTLTPPSPVTNVAPVITSNGGGIVATVAVAENQTAVTTVVAMDADAGQTVTFTLSGADAGLFTLSSTGELTFNTAPDFEMLTDTGMDNEYEVTITATDNGMPEKMAMQMLTITVTDVTNENNAPVFAEGATATVSYAENATTVVTTVVATDADSGQTVSFTLSGADAGQFSITPAGELTFNTAPDYENPVDMGGNNEYEVTITATDNGMPEKMAMQTLTITVTDVTNENNAPVFAEGATATVSYAENVTTAVTTVVATDEDAGQTITLALSGDDGGLFSITTAGVLTFNMAPDFEMPTDTGRDNVYEVTITATDDGTPAKMAMQALTITVTDVNEPLGLEAFTGIEVYPNPAGAVLHISGVEGHARYTLSGID